MQLTLSLQTPSRVKGASSTYAVSEGSAIIGRAAGADWHLPDAERILSKRHCRIDTQPTGFIVTDLSTNGVCVNSEPIGYQRSRQLKDGDRLRLGDIDLCVSIAAGEVKPIADGTKAPLPADGPFGNDAIGNPANSESLSSQAGAKKLWTANDAVGEQAPADASKAHSHHASNPGSTLTSPPSDAIVMRLTHSFPTLDAIGLALAVDSAGAEIPEAYWQPFYRCLYNFLQERYPEE